jgi:homocitrate synthase NifV
MTPDMETMIKKNSFQNKCENISVPYLIDTTLRDGEQAPGVVFSADEKLIIAQMLDEIGIDEIEAGSPFIYHKEIDAIRKIVKAGLHSRISCWSRARFDDIDKAALTGAPGINISFPVSEIQLAAISKDREWIFQTMPNLVRYAQKRFKFVSLGAQDASRANFNLLSDYLKRAEELGIHRVRIADTIGNLNPASTFDLLSRLKSTLCSGNMQLEFHGHNDLGMATANTITAIQTGINCVSVTVNGLGERTGNAALEEVVMAMKHSMGIPVKYKTGQFSLLCSFVAQASKRKLHQMKPVVGEMAFKHESGIHTNSLLKNARSYQLFDAVDVGVKDKGFVFGSHSGSAALMNFLNRKSIKVKKEKALIILDKIKNISIQKKRGLTQTEVEEVCCKIGL